MGIGGTYLNIVKVIYDKPTANIILNAKKAEGLPAKFRNKIRMPILTASIQPSIGNLSHSNLTRKRDEMFPNLKRRCETLFAADMILHIENPKDST